MYTFQYRRSERKGRINRQSEYRSACANLRLSARIHTRNSPSYRNHMDEDAATSHCGKQISGIIWLFTEHQQHGACLASKRTNLSGNIDAVHSETRTEETQPSDTHYSTRSSGFARYGYEQASVKDSSFDIADFRPNFEAQT